MIPMLAKKAAEYIGIVGVILSALWFIGEPMAQTFIQETVKERIDGVEQQITKEAADLTETIEEIAETVEQQLSIETEKDDENAKAVEERLKAGELSDIRQESDLVVVKDDLEEVRESQKTMESDIKAILGGIRQLQATD